MVKKQGREGGRAGMKIYEMRRGEDERKVLRSCDGAKRVWRRRRKEKEENKPYISFQGSKRFKFSRDGFKRPVQTY